MQYKCIAWRIHISIRRDIHIFLSHQLHSAKEGVVDSNEASVNNKNNIFKRANACFASCIDTCVESMKNLHGCSLLMFWTCQVGRWWFRSVNQQPIVCTINSPLHAPSLVYNDTNAFSYLYYSWYSSQKLSSTVLYTSTHSNTTYLLAVVIQVCEQSFPQSVRRWRPWKV